MSLGIKLGTPSPVDLNVWSPTSWALAPLGCWLLMQMTILGPHKKPTKPEALRVAQQEAQQAQQALQVILRSSEWCLGSLAWPIQTHVDVLAFVGHWLWDLSNISPELGLYLL